MNEVVGLVATENHWHNREGQPPSTENPFPLLASFLFLGTLFRKILGSHLKSCNFLVLRVIISNQRLISTWKICFPSYQRRPFKITIQWITTIQTNYKSKVRGSDLLIRQENEDIAMAANTGCMTERSLAIRVAPPRYRSLLIFLPHWFAQRKKRRHYHHSLRIL